MKVHANAALGPAGRFALVQAIESGMTLRAAAAALNVAPATAHRWWHRWLAATPDERQSGAWLVDRPSIPKRSPRLLGRAAQERICECRRHTGWGPRLVAGATGHPHSTVWKVLRRHGISRPPRPPREAANRYEWPCPGDLLHMDTSHYARFERPGHAVTGDRRRKGARLSQPGTGYEIAHAIVDDHSRLAYVELLDDERAPTVTAFVSRALEWFSDRGIESKRVMTDNAWSYVRNRSLAELLAARGIKHLTTQAYRPRTNGKVERFHQTMAREWAYGLAYRSSQDRARALPHWLRYYNERRPHSSLGGRPPISRVHNVRGQDI
jgi:transposase InsO family protein